ncbi:hypothetical protein RCL1_008554 [Eukaryota sp. TZLM3-RCL]
MCKHIINAQVSIRTPCCKRWVDCPECHAEFADHEMGKTTELTLACKKCKKVFRVDLGDPEADEADHYCPHCDNLYVLDAVTQEDKMEEATFVNFEKSLETSTSLDQRMVKNPHPLANS